MQGVLWVLALLWVWLGWTMAASGSPDVGAEIERSYRLLAPLSKRSCGGSEDVKCIDDCSFLCLESDARCVGGKCVLPAQKKHLQCNAEKGGVAVLVKEPHEHWECLCTNPTFWTGEDCGTLAPDACENGVLMYSGRRDQTCVCHFPYRKITLYGKTYCVEPAVVNFFRDDDSAATPHDPRPAFGPSNSHI